MSKRITINLNKKDSLASAIKQIEEYQKSLDAKCREFVEELARIGVNVAMMTLANDGFGDAPRDADFDIKIDSIGNLVAGVLKVSGAGVLYWEFGAGFQFNGGGGNPKAGELGFGPGTYPGQTHVPIPGFWYYRDELGDAVRSYGTQATMPMYKASLEMIQRIGEIGKRVFGNG